MSILAFILAVFPIVIIHEFGHFLVGKYLGAEPTDFAVGFGKPLFTFKFLGANFKVGWIPLGGYVKFKKVQFDTELGEDGKKSEKISAWRWFFISIAGPVSNFILTSAIFFGIMMVAFSSIQSGEVKSSRYEGVKSGDKILIVKESGFANFLKRNMLTASESNYFLKTDEGTAPLTITPQEFESLINIETQTLPFTDRFSRSALAGVEMIGSAFTNTTIAIFNLFTPEGYKGMMGPIGIAGEANKAMEMGFLQYLLLVASLSFAVGYFNLLPISFLDGGRAILAVLETLTSRSINDKVLGHLNVFGFAMIILLMGMGFFSDITRMMNN